MFSLSSKIRTHSCQFLGCRRKMKKLFIFLLIYNSFVLSTSAKNFVPFSIGGIIQDFYVNRSEAFDIIIHGSNTEKLKIVKEIMRMTSMASTVKIVCMTEDDKSVIRVNRSAVVLLDSLKHCQNFHDRVNLTNRFPRPLYFLTYIYNFDESQKQSLNGPGKSKMFEYETFLMHNVDSYRLITFLIFQQPNCRVVFV